VPEGEDIMSEIIQTSEIACSDCANLLHVRPGDGCLLCAFGTVPCPPVRA